MMTKKLYCAVKKNGECIKFKTGLTFGLYKVRHNLTDLAIVYQNADKEYPCSIYTGFDTWNGEDNGIFEQYKADARVNRTPKQCANLILSHCEIAGKI